MYFSHFPLPVTLKQRHQQPAYLFVYNRGQIRAVEHSHWSRSVKILCSDWLKVENKVLKSVPYQHISSDLNCLGAFCDFRYLLYGMINKRMERTDSWQLSVMSDIATDRLRVSGKIAHCLSSGVQQQCFILMLTLLQIEYRIHSKMKKYILKLSVFLIIPSRSSDPYI